MLTDFGTRYEARIVRGDGSGEWIALIDAVGDPIEGSDFVAVMEAARGQEPPEEEGTLVIAEIKIRYHQIPALTEREPK